MSWGLITGLPAHTQRSVGWLKRSSKRAVRLLTSTFGWMRLVLRLGILQFGDVEKHTHTTNMYFNGHPPYFAWWFQWLFDVQPYFWDELAFIHFGFFHQTAGTFLVGVGTWYCIRKWDSDGQLGQTKTEQIPNLGIVDQNAKRPTASNLRHTGFTMFKDVQSTFCARVQKFHAYYCGYEHVWSGLQWNPVFLVIKLIKQFGSCISPEKIVVDLLPRPGLSTTSKSTWGTPGGSACSQA